MSPQRIQLKRTKGWRKPEGAVVVARPSKWGNPFTIAGAIENGWADDETEAQKFAVECFEDWLSKGVLSDWSYDAGRDRNDWMRDRIRDLRGRDLACWCPLDQPCHADVLLKVANS